MAELFELRQDIDRIDAELFRLFAERAEVAESIAEYKRLNNLRIYDHARERQKVFDAAERVPADLKTYGQVFMELLMEASRHRQNEVLRGTTPNPDLERIDAARRATPALFPASATVACQGVEGAYSQIATDHFFRHPAITYVDTFQGVFRAVEEGLCEYGVLPIENSTAGSVNKVFDLMQEHDFHVIRTTRIKIDHNLLAKPGTTIDQVRDIYSHEQAINQCASFLEGMPGVRVHVCENTAMAARRVAGSDRTDVAALSSRSCAALYELDVLAADVQDRDNNYTRFACISKDLEVFPGSNRTSLMLVVNHDPGALYKVLAKLYALDINVIKLESRPIPERDFEFMQYLDVECPVDSPEFRELMTTLPDVCEELRYVGSYSEVV